MLRLKQFLAFPMYGAAAWLVWVLAQETGANGVAIVLAAFVALALAAWLWTVTRELSLRGRGLGTIAALLVLLAGFYGISMLHGAATQPPAASATANAQALHAGTAGVVARQRQAGIRGRDRGLVHHLSGQ